MVGQSDAPVYEYTSAQIESRLIAAPDFMRRHVLPAGHDEFEMVILNPDGSSMFSLPPLTVPTLGQNITASQAQFIATLRSLGYQADRVLEHQSDADALEYHALLFWPAFSALHSFLGMDLRADELIAALDEMRSQFRLRPVTAEALTALAQVLQKSAAASPLTADLVDECRDVLEAAGVAPRFPLTFAAPDED